MSEQLAGYPQSSGAKLESIIEITGPASYSAISPATPPTGGQLVYASQFGLKYIDHIEGSMSDDGTYEVIATHGVSHKEPVSSVRLMWRVANGGAEASGNLSARTVRLRAIGL